ncbi:MAG: Calx-beta domain-containing protein [Arenicellales bacterium]|nr:Calx-beta domain-containing protein [Arenicellales bacterium]
MSFGQSDAGTTYSVLENVGTAYIPVTLDEAASQTITVTYQTGSGGTATAGGTDYTALTSATLTFNPGDTIAYIPLVIANDTTDEDAQTVTIELSSVTYNGSASTDDASFVDKGTTETGTVTIVDDDGAVEWLVKDGAQLEQSAAPDSGVRLTVMRTGTETNLTATHTIDYTTAAATGHSTTVATSGTDFTAANGTLTFASTTLNEGGTLSSSDTTITVTSVTNFATGGGVVTIENEDISYSGITGNNLTGVVRGINGTTAATHADGKAANETGVYVDVVGSNDATSEIAENLAVTVSSASAGTIADATGIGTIIDNDANTVSYGNALNFDGTDDLIDITDAANISVTSNYTIEAWVYSTKAVATDNGSNTYQGIVSKGDYDYQLGLADKSGALSNQETGGNDHNLFFYENGAPTSTNVVAAGVGVAVNAWTHVAVTNDGTDHKIYLDGTLVQTSTATGMVDGARALIIGASLKTGRDGSGGKVDYTDWFKGSIDDVRLWNEARTVGEVNANKKVALRGDEEGLIGYWKLDNSLTDSAGLGSGDGVANNGRFYDGDDERTASYLVSNSDFVASTAGDGDPIVLDLDGNGVELVGRDAGARFDVTGDGTTDATGWMGSGEGLLALDVDGDGVINGMSEVFSDAFDSGYSDSLTALKSLDSNADGVIDASDERFDEIVVWRDGDSDGVSGAAEMSSLSDHAIASINLSAETTYESSAAGHIDARGTFVYDDGSAGEYVEATFAFTDTAIVGATVDDVGEAEPFTVDVSSSPIAVDEVVVTETASVLVEEEAGSEAAGDSHLADSSSGVAAAAPTEDVPVSVVESESEPVLEEEIDGYVVYPTAAVAAVAVTEPVSLAA